MSRLVHIGTLLGLTLLTLSGCGRMRAAEWPSSALTGGSSGGGGSTPRTASYKSVQTYQSRTCTISQTGELHCWGENGQAQVTAPPEWTVGRGEVLGSGGGPAEPIQSAPTGFWIPHASEKKKHILSISTQSELNHLCAVIGNEHDPGIPSGDIHCYGAGSDPQMFGANVGATGKLTSNVRFTRVKTSEKVTCALAVGGQLYCIWNSPAFASTELELVPLPASASVWDFAVGTNHICVILNTTLGTNQQLYCWGDNTQKQLGVNSPGSYSVTDFSFGAVTPIDLTSMGGPNQFSQVFASDNQTCAIGVDQAIYCWGRTLPPIKVSDGSWRVRTASLGLGHNCMMYDDLGTLENGKIACAGENQFGQLGRGTDASDGSLYESIPMPVLDNSVGNPELTGFSQVSVGQAFTCAIDQTTAIHCWGRNSTQKEIDQNTVTNFKYATETRSTLLAATVATGNDFSCVVRTDDTLTCNGNNLFRDTQEGGSPSHPTFLDSGTVLGPYFFTESPGALPGAPRLNPMASSNRTTCISAQSSNGGLECWGLWYDPVLTRHDTPVPITIDNTTDGVSYVAVGSEHFCAIRYGALYCWGNNILGQVNGNTSVSRYTEPQLIFQTGVTAVAVGEEHTCAIVASDVVCWGGNTSGQVGIGRRSVRVPYPVKVMNGPATALAAGQYHTCAIVGSDVRCWGKDDLGQLGNGVGNSSSASPILPTLDPNYDPIEIVAGFDHTCYKGAHKTLLNNYRLFCWGSNNAGELGRDPTTFPQLDSPTQVSLLNLSDRHPVAAGGDNTCFTVQGPNDQIYCMGDNSYAQLGNGFPELQIRTDFNPKEVLSFNIGASNIHLALGANHLCYDVGGTFCIGSNANGQLGNGKSYQLKVPAPMSLFSSGVEEVALGMNHTCALLNNGNLHCWGVNRVINNRVLPELISKEIVVDIQTPSMTGVDHVAAFDNATCISQSGNLRCWGENSNGVLGISPITSPWVNHDAAMAAAPLLTGNVRGIFMSASRACALVDQELKCWGDNSNEGLRTGAGFISTPATIASNVERAVVAEWGVCYAGTGPLECHVAPSNADAVTLQTAVTNRNFESIHDLVANPWSPLLCATETGGTLACGGDNSSGVLGPFGLASSLLDFEPVTTDTLKFSMSLGHLCHDQGGTIQCAGTDGSGQLGNGPEDFNSQSSFVSAEY